MPNRFNNFNPRKKTPLKRLFKCNAWVQNDKMDRIFTIVLTILVFIVILLLFFLRNMNLLPNVPSGPIRLETYE